MAKNPITVLQEGNKLLNELEAKLTGVNSSIIEISQAARSNNLKDYFNVKAPNDVNEKLKLQKTIIEQLNAQVKERDRLEASLNRQIAKNQLAESKLAKELAVQRVETQQRNRLIKETAVLSSTLSTEYQKLVVRMNQAGRVRQSLIAKQAQGNKLSNKEQAELKQSSAAFFKYEKAVLKADRSINRFQRNVGNYSSAINKSVFALRNFAGAFGAFSASLIAREIFELTKELDGLDKALLQVTETQEGFNQAQSFIRDLADEAGVNINGLQKAYTKFFAAAKTTNLTLSETQDIFRQTSKAGAALGLSTDDINGSLKALEQILSKGKVQAEEIRGQLGERLPGAFQILAKSMGLTTAELSKQLELGNVLSEEVLPGFARELEKTYSLDKIERIDTLTASQNRLGNEWTEFVRSLDNSNGILTKTFSYVINGLSDILKALAELNKGREGLDDDLFQNARKTAIETAKDLTKAEQSNIRLIQTTLNNTKLSAEERLKLESEIEKIQEGAFQRNVSQATYNKAATINEIRGLETKLRIARQLKEEQQSGRSAFQNFIKQDLKAEKAIEALENSLARAKGRLEGLNDVLGENTGKTDDNSEAVKENTIVREAGLKAVKGSLEFYQAVISELENEQNKLATNQREWDAYEDKITEAQQALSKFKAEINGVNNLDTIGDAESALQRIIDIVTNPQKIEGLDESGIESAREFAKEFEELEEKKRDAAKETAEFRKELERELADSIVDFTNTIFDAKVQKYDDEIQKNNDKYAAILDNEELSEEQRSAIEAERDRKNADLEKKKRQEQRKQAQFNKAIKLIEIGFATSKAIAESVALSPLTGGQPFATIAAVIGAIQAATVLATPIPQYEKGKNYSDNYEGAAIWGEKRRELKIGKNGSIELSPKRIGNHLTHVKKDDVIIPDANKFLSNLSDQQLYDNLHKYSILANMAGQSETINSYIQTKALEDKIDRQTNKIVDAINKNKTKIHLSNNNSIGDDLAFLARLQSKI